jgi:hypothetical protein
VFSFFSKDRIPASSKLDMLSGGGMAVLGVDGVLLKKKMLPLR